MHVIATAGHVDHGKTTLVRLLTGQDPDRLGEEKRRGLTIELGFAWTRIEPVGDVAFVDVPGHERFVPTMLSGIGPVPAVLLVVAADDPWMPQAAEHLSALNALGVAHGVVAVSRSDLADPTAAVARVRAELAVTTLADAPVLPVSGRTGAGLDALRSALASMVQTLPSPSHAADVRMWIDRRFSITGAGTVVTGTLPEGTIRVGDTLSVDSTTVRVRSMQTLGRPTEAASGVARVALNLVGADARQLDRGSALVTPDAWHHAVESDVLLSPLQQNTADPSVQSVLHVGATSVGVHFRTLAGNVARLRLRRALPLRIGDRALLRDPGSRRAWAVTILDPTPPALARRRGAARERGERLAGITTPDLGGEVSRRGVVAVDELRRLGVPVTETAIASAGTMSVDGWLISSHRVRAAKRQLATTLAELEATAPLVHGVPLAVLADRLGLPSVELVRSLVHPPLRIESGRVITGSSLPERVRQAVEVISSDLHEQPFVAPSATRLAKLGLGSKETAAAARAGLLLRLAPGIVLLPGADVTAVAWLEELAQPFTIGEAGKRLRTTRRVTVPLLEHLARTGRTRRLPDGRHEVIVR